MNRGSNKGSDGSRKSGGNPPAKLNRDIQAKLGDQLRQMYNDVVSQGVPDKFSDLLAQLDQGAPKNAEPTK